MRNSRPKKISKIIKESLIRFVVFGILAFFEDKVYKDHPECPRCKSSKRIAHRKTRHRKENRKRKKRVRSL